MLVVAQGTPPSTAVANIADTTIRELVRRDVLVLAAS
jgi:hypothetical protein